MFQRNSNARASEFCYHKFVYDMNAIIGDSNEISGQELPILLSCQFNTDTAARTPIEASTLSSSVRLS